MRVTSINNSIPESSTYLYDCMYLSNYTGKVVGSHAQVLVCSAGHSFLVIQGHKVFTVYIGI